MTAKRRLLAVLVLGIIPWTVVTTDDFVSLVFPFGLVTPDPFHLLTIFDYLRFSGGQVAQYIDAWPIGALLYVGTLVSAVVAVFGYENPRLTGGCLVFTALSQIPFVIGFSRRLEYTVFPVGTILMLAVAWWFYWPVVRASND